MHIERIQPDILLFRGEAYHSVATAFLAQGNVLLVDALAKLPRRTADAGASVPATMRK